MGKERAKGYKDIKCSMYGENIETHLQMWRSGEKNGQQARRGP